MPVGCSTGRRKRIACSLRDNVIKQQVHNDLAFSYQIVFTGIINQVDAGHYILIVVCVGVKLRNQYFKRSSSLILIRTRTLSVKAKTDFFEDIHLMTPCRSKFDIPDSTIFNIPVEIEAD